MLDPSTRLRNAVIKGALPIVERILSRFPELWLNVDSNHQGWTNIHYASYYGHYLVCSFLITFIKNDPDFNNENGDNFSTLDLLTFDNKSVLHLCMEKHHSQTLHYLLQEFPGKLWLNHKCAKSNQTPLHHSCMYNFNQGTRLLLDFGADYSITDSDGNTCLHLCFQFGSIDCIKEILQHILKINKFDKERSRIEIDKFQNIKNYSGWLAKDFSSSFEMINQYEDLKLCLLSFDLPESTPSDYDDLYSNTSAITQQNSRPSLDENKVLTSPIVSMSSSQSQSESQPVQTRKTKSQSLSNGDQTNQLKSINLRKRSNTSYSYKISSSSLPPPMILNNEHNHLLSRSSSNSIAPLTPLTPQMNQTPSLKSVTISPSCRSLNTLNNNYYNLAIDDEPNSPSSFTSTTSSSFTFSPNHKSSNPEEQRKKSFSKSAALPPINSENESWPSIKPISPLTQEHQEKAGSKPKSTSSASSIAAKVAFNSSRASLNQLDSPTKSLQPSQRSIEKSNSFMSTSSNCSSDSSSSVINNDLISTQNTIVIGNSDDSNTTFNYITNEEKLRRSRSSGTLPFSTTNSRSNSNNNNEMIFDRKANSSMHSLSSTGSDKYKKMSVNSINFSRVR